MKTLKAIVLLGAASLVAAEPDYSGALTSLWTQSDTDADGSLSLAEFKSAADKLDLKASDLYNHVTLDAFYADINTDGGGLSKKELADSMNTYPSYRSVLKDKFTNGAGSVPTGIPTPTSAMQKALAKVTMEIELAGKVSDLYPGTRKKIAKYFADTCGVTVADVVMTYLPKSSSVRLRALQTSGSDGVVVKGTAFVADNAAADAAAKNLPKDKAGFQAVPAFSGLEVTSAKVVLRRELAIPIPEAAITGGALLVIGIVLCSFASVVARRRSSGVSPRGCCSTGCCSFYAVKPWACGEFVALCAFAGCLFFLFTRMTALTTTIDGLIGTLLAIANSTVSAISSLASALPSSIISQIQQNRAQLQLLPVAVMVPGAFCIVFLLLATLCPLTSARKGTYCCSKCMIMLANVFLLVSFIFYIIFVALAVIIQFAPPSIKQQIGTITGMCDSVPPMLQQLVADNVAGLDALVAAGQPESSLTDLRKMLNDVEVITTTIAGGCKHLNQLFVDIFNLFLPGLMCITAIVFSFFVNNTLCCAEGCCKAPPKAGAPQAGVEMSKPDAQQSV